MSSNIADKVIVITGASSGLGEATARHLASQGATVVLGARRVQHLERIAADIAETGGKALVHAVDVSRPEEVRALMQKAVDTFGRVDVLVNNAGVMTISPLDALEVDAWSRMIDINIKGVLHGIAAALPIFQKQGSGHFVNIASVAALKVFSPGGAVYSATKFAVRAISEGLRQEVGGAIRTTTIAPGAVESELKLGSSHGASVDALNDFYKLAIPADSVARAIAYAIEQPADVDINEIVLRPTAQVF